MATGRFSIVAKQQDKPFFIFIYTSWAAGRSHGLPVKLLLHIFELHISDMSFIANPSRFPARHLTRLLYVCAVCLLLPTTALAQNQQQLATGFERDVNRYRWTADLRLQQRIKKWQFAATNRFSSDAFILFNNLLSFRDENQLSWLLDRTEATSSVVPHFKGRLAWYSQSRVLSQDVYAFTTFKLLDVLSFEPAIGFAMDQRPGANREDGSAPLQNDAGPAFGGQLRFLPRNSSTSNVAIEAGGNLQLINPRRGSSVRMAGQAERLFAETRLGSTFSYSNARRDAYQAISFLNRDTDSNLLTQTIEATTSDTLFIGLELESPLTKTLKLTSNVDFTANNRKIRTYQAPDQSIFFDTDFNRRTVDAEVGLLFENRRVVSHLTMQGGAEFEQRQLANRDELPPVQATQKGDLLEQADYDRSFFTLRLRNQIAVTQKMDVRTEGTANILRHDTPLANQDDRDEAFFNGLVGIQYRLSPYVAVNMNVFGSYYHTVYLKARRSAENNVQRTLRFRPTIIWTPAQATYFRVTSEVRATYTVDDFVLEGRRPTDQSARELRYESEFKQDLGEGIQLQVNGGFSDLRLGRFLQDSFAEIPFDTLQTYSGWVRLRSEGRLNSEIGVRVFTRTDFERANTVRYRRIDENGDFVRDEEGTILRSTVTRQGRRWIEQIGPTMALVWPMPRGSAIRLDGWLNFQRIRQRLYGDLPEELADHIQREAQRGTLKTIPNIALSVIWNL